MLAIAGQLRADALADEQLRAGDQANVAGETGHAGAEAKQMALLVQQH